uniref:Uncharacterized protein n=1 Tax=Candidatus Kentrum sp. DK TaxID=2126562 RepID=A0A450TJV9_9GAMM|nr:MAG: hypothetical protein BECKDK2373C_GA0170839_11684 [Candidatus Kentron sp. DK]VFJ69924.1 MAG: hypothetical protein BECKDK2373B_GA0170837_12594 [Candidatus Kentron sp. DK]
MDWKLLFPHLGTVIVVFIGWFVVHLLNAYRDRRNKRREIRVQYLIKASHSRLLHNCLILNKIFWFVFVNYLCFESTC